MRNKKFIGHLVSYSFLTPYLILFLVFLIGPLIFGFGLSFFRWELLATGPPEFVGVGNYSEALASVYFRKALWATTRYVSMKVPLHIILALLIAVGINAVIEKRQSIYRAAIFFPSLLTVTIVSILWRWFYNREFGLFNMYLSTIGIKLAWLADATWAMKSIVLMSLWWGLGGTVIILLAGLKQIPKRYYEAARIDGANAVQQFFYITLPLLKPILLFVTVMGFIGAFQVFGQTFIMTPDGGPELSTRVLVHYIYLTAFRFYRMGYGSAMSWLLFVIIAFFTFIQFWLSREKQINA